MSDYKVNLVNEEQPSIAEKEEQVLESAGVDTKQDDGVYRVDLSKPPKTQEDAVQEQSTDEVPVSEGTETSQEVGEEVRGSEEPTEQEEPIIELIKEESNAEEVQQGQEELQQQAQSQKEELQQEEVADPIDLPENIQKVVDFMKETGGTLEDYVRLNTDYSSVDEKTLLKEYYKQTKSHLDNEEIDFLIEDNFSFDEDLDEERDIKRKKLAYKEELTKARNFLGDLKSKYYDEVKMTSRLAPEQKEAIEFYNQYKQQQEELTAAQAKQSEAFVKQTESVFNQEFKGFDFKVGENKYRFKVQDVEQTKKAQSDIVEVFGKFLDENNMLKDANGYHKALFAARNADKIANHFYEQGRAEAIKRIEAEAKNINMDPRKTNQGFIDAGGVKVRAVSGEDSSKLRIKIKQ
jgi:hypothetical protein